MPLTAETATAIEQHFTRYGRRRHRLARLYGDTVKLRVYAKCIYGQQRDAMHRIWQPAQ